MAAGYFQSRPNQRRATGEASTPNPAQGTERRAPLDGARTCSASHATMPTVDTTVSTVGAAVPHTAPTQTGGRELESDGTSGLWVPLGLGDRDGEGVREGLPVGVTLELALLLGDGVRLALVLGLGDGVLDGDTEGEAAHRCSVWLAGLVPRNTGVPAHSKDPPWSTATTLASGTPAKLSIASCRLATMRSEMVIQIPAAGSSK